MSCVARPHSLHRLALISTTPLFNHHEQRGYLLGGIEFWRTQIELGASTRPGIIELLNDHPPAYKRLAMLMEMAGYSTR